MSVMTSSPNGNRERFYSVKDIIENARQTGDTQLNLANKHLSENIDELNGVWELEALEKLNLAANDLTFIPHGITKLSSLKILVLKLNNLVEIDEKWLGKNLEYLSFSYNSMLSTIPDSISSLQHLTSLDIRGCGFPPGELPNQVFLLTGLRSLSIGDLKLGPELPRELGLMWNLEFLDASDNEIEIINVLGELDELRTLLLNRNHLTGLDCSCLKNLEELDVSENNLESFPLFHEDCDKLTRLDVSYNSITIMDDATLSRMRNLVYFNAESNHITRNPRYDTLKILENSLEELNLCNNPIAEPLPAPFNIMFPIALSIPHLVTYWEDRNGDGDDQEYRPGLWISGMDAAANKVALIKRNIREILNVAPELGPAFVDTDEFTYHTHLAFDDFPDVDILERLPLTNKVIAAAREAGHGILCHCRAGQSRSAAVCLAYLMAHQHIPLDHAMKQLQDVRPIVSPNVGFMNQLEILDDKLCMEVTY